MRRGRRHVSEMPGAHHSNERPSELHIEAVEHGGPHPFDLDDLVDLSVADVRQVLGSLGLQQLLVEQLSVEEEPDAAHE